jgi:hypothetical protein
MKNQMPFMAGEATSPGQSSAGRAIEFSENRCEESQDMLSRVYRVEYKIHRGSWSFI